MTDRLNNSKHILSTSILGEGNPVILLHGISSSGQEWKYLSKVLIKNNFQTFAPDLIGHGNSSKPSEMNAYKTSNQIHVLTQWIESLSINTQFDLIGHSYGGFLSLHIAAQFPERVRKLILINPFYKFDQLSTIHSLIFSKPKLFVTAWKIYNRVLKRTAPSPLILYILEDVGYHPIKSKITHKTIVIWGEKDRTLKPSSFYFLTKNLLQNFISYPIPKCGHVPHRSNVEYVNKIILNFLIQ